MSTEIERKFLVKGNGWKKLATADSLTIKQGYLAKSRATTVRIRIANDKAYITVKGKRVDLACPEFEYEIPLTDAEQLIKMSITPIVEKTRYIVNIDDQHKWEIDVFGGINTGLVMAEIEFAENTPTVVKNLPRWIGTEVSYDKRYTNTYIAEHVVPHTC